MKTFLLTFALLAACCTASTPSEYRNLTTTEIDYCSHVQTLIPTGLNKILETNELQNQFNTTDFVLDKINFVSQKEFKKGYIYKINVDFINSAGEIAHTQFLGVYKNKSRKLSVHSFTYTVEYPQMDYDLEEEFKPSPINGTHSTGIFKDLRNYIQENFNKTQDILLFRNTTTMYNSTYLPQDLNMSSTYDAPQNYSSGSYNNTWMNKTYSEYSGPQRLNNTAYNSNSSHNNTWVNKTYSGYSGLQRLNNTANRTNTAYNSSSSYNNTWMNKTYSEYYGPERTNNTNYLSYNETASNATSSYNITEAVYKSLNMLVDMFNSTDLEIEEIEVDLEPLIGTVFEFVSKSLEESFDIQFGKIIDKLIDFEPSSETMPAIPKKHKSVFT